jgi:hypothetical protein
LTELFFRSHEHFFEVPVDDVDRRSCGKQNPFAAGEDLIGRKSMTEPLASVMLSPFQSPV